MVENIRRNLSFGCVLIAALLNGNCSTDLRRNDLEGRPCPCLDGWEAHHWEDGSCTCIRPGSASTGGVQGSGGSNEGGTTVIETWSGGASSGGTGLQSTGGRSTGGTDGNGGTGAGGTDGNGGTSTVGSGGMFPSGGVAGTLTSGSGGTSGNAGSVSGTTTGCPAPSTIPITNVFRPDCSAAQSCSTTPISCFDGAPCEVNCTGNLSCSNVSIQCPSGYSCTVTCAGNKACDGLTVNCNGASICSLVCVDGAPNCDKAKLECGAGDCLANCGAKAAFPTVSNCGTSCRGSGCECK